MTATSSPRHHQHNWLLAVAVLFAIGYWFSLQAKDRGWLPHTDLANVEFPTQEWTVGASAICSAERLNAQAVELDCGGSTAKGNAKEMNVRFFGKVDDNSKDFNCHRDSVSITCRLPGK
jgi:hypothetical protein